MGIEGVLYVDSVRVNRAAVGEMEAEIELGDVLETLIYAAQLSFGEADFVVVMFRDHRGGRDKGTIFKAGKERKYVQGLTDVVKEG